MKKIDIEASRTRMKLTNSDHDPLFHSGLNGTIWAQYRHRVFKTSLIIPPYNGAEDS